MYEALIQDYLAGADRVRDAIGGLTPAQLAARPIAGQWSIQQAVCHLADFEPIYADRMKRVLAEEQPTFVGGDPDLFAARLAYDRRPPEVEIALIDAVRRQMAIVLRSLSAEDFERTGRHPRDGALTLATLLQRITEHVAHHLKFVAAKRRVLESLSGNLKS